MKLWEEWGAMRKVFGTALPIAAVCCWVLLMLLYFDICIVKYVLYNPAWDQKRKNAVVGINGRLSIVTIINWNLYLENEGHENWISVTPLCREGEIFRSCLLTETLVARWNPLEVLWERINYPHLQTSVAASSLQSLLLHLVPCIFFNYNYFLFSILSTLGY